MTLDYDRSILSINLKYDIFTVLVSSIIFASVGVKVDGIIILLVFMGVSASVASRMSLTFDETTYIGSGNYYLLTGNYSKNIEHPPLLKKLFALSSLYSRPNTSILSSGGPLKEQYTLGREFIFCCGNDADRIIFASRMVNVIENNITDYYISYWGTDSLAYRGLENHSIECSKDGRFIDFLNRTVTLDDVKRANTTIFVSVNNVYLKADPCFTPLRAIKPRGNVGYSILYYRLDS